jgi:LysM repeat protein
MAGDTIEQIAADYQVTQTDLMAGNCLVSTTLLPGTILYIPFPTPTASPQPTKVPQPTAPATVTPIPINTIVTCGAPRGWVIYSVQAGDTLYKLSVIFGITINQLQVANCLGSSTNIYTGQRLYVPDNRLNIPTPTRTLTRTPVPTTRPSTTLSPLPTPNLTATIQKQTADAQATQAALEAASTQAALNATNTQAAINATNTQAAINATNTQAAINATNTQVAINATNTQAAINATNTQAVIDATSTQAAINAQNTQVAGSATAAAASATASYCETQAALNTPCPP